MSTLSLRAQNFINGVDGAAEKFAESDAKYFPVCPAKDESATEVRAELAKRAFDVADIDGQVCILRADAEATVGGKAGAGEIYAEPDVGIDLSDVADKATRAHLARLHAALGIKVKE